MTLRILVVEDEMMIAMLVEDMLLDLGHETVGPAAKFDAGIELATSEMLDLAILDVNLGGNRSFPIADLLVARGVPVIFATGYGAAGLDPQYAGFPVITKPFRMEALAKIIDTAGRPKQVSTSMRA
jgi:DNA-binding response OmpR family regulator